MQDVWLKSCVAVLLLAVLVGGCVETPTRCHSTPLEPDAGGRAVGTEVGPFEESRVFTVVGVGPNETRPLVGARVAAALAIPLAADDYADVDEAIAALEDGERGTGFDGVLFASAVAGTGSDGTVTFRVPAGTRMAVVASLDGWTTEVAAPGWPREEQTRIDLYRGRVERTFDGEQPAFLLDTRRVAYPPAFGIVAPGYRERWEEVSATLRWNNTPEAGADLGLWLELPYGDGDSDSARLLSGNGAQIRTVKFGDFPDYINFDDVVVHVTSSLRPSVEPVPYRLNVTATFHGATEPASACVPYEAQTFGPVDLGSLRAD